MAYRGCIRIFVRIGLVRVISLVFDQGLLDLLSYLPAALFPLLPFTLLLVVLAFVTSIKNVGRELFFFDTFLHGLAWWIGPGGG